MGFTASATSPVSGWYPTSATGYLVVADAGMYDETTHQITAEGHQDDTGSTLSAQTHYFGAGEWDKIAPDGVLSAELFFAYVLGLDHLELAMDSYALLEGGYQASANGTLQTRYVGTNGAGEYIAETRKAAGETTVAHTIPAGEWQYCKTGSDFDPVKFILWLMRKARGINKLPPNNP